MIPVCVCFLALLITSTTAASGLPLHLRRSNEKDSLNSGEEILTSNEIRSKNDDAQNHKENLASYEDGEDFMGFKDQDLAAPGWWWDDEGSHNLTQGQKIYQDILLSSQYIYKSYRFLRIVEATVYHHPPQGRDQYYINYIQATDQHSDFSEAGYARIVKDGVGHTNVTLHLQSKRNQDLKFLVQIWGHRSF
uniref:Uncharacterized protein n=1 Tax=Cacopsylla melanoneura TaxID=428564 RepID=A0A8D8LGS9_9HEMI